MDPPEVVKVHIMLNTEAEPRRSPSSFAEATENILPLTIVRVWMVGQFELTHNSNDCWNKEQTRICYLLHPTFINVATPL